MKKSVIFILLIVFTVHIFSESLWSGNAAIASEGEFSADTDYFQAASNTFPSGTMLKVTNPRNGLSVNVKVVKRLSRPGVFIILDRKSGEIIDLPDDHVMPVRVTPVSGGSGVMSEEELPVTEKIYSDDPDLNISSDAESFKDKEITPAPESPAVDIVDEPKPENIEKYEIEEETKSVNIKETPDTTDKSEDTGVSEKSVGKNGNVIYFLTPADLRPPEETADVTETEESSSFSAESADTDISGANENVEKSPEEYSESADADSFTASVDERKSPEEYSESARNGASDTRSSGSTVKKNIPSAVLSGNFKYIQIGAYENFAVLTDTYRIIKQKAPGYPLCYSEENINGHVIYRLLIGPLMPAETGTVLNTAKRTAFPDAFIYNYDK